MEVESQEREKEVLPFHLQLDERLELRELQEEDAKALFQLTDRNRVYLREWLGWVDDTRSIRDTLEYIELSEDQHARNDGFQAGIWLDNQLVGAIGYHYMDWQRKQTEIGYWLSQEFEGQGIVTRACEAIIEYAFSLGLQTILICCAIENVRSQAIPERLGFLRTGVEHDGEWLYDHYVDLIVFRMEAARWLAS